DLSTFKAKLLEFDIFVWKEPNGLRIRIHGCDHKIFIVISNLRKLYVMRGTLSFSDVVKKIERALGLPPEGYELTYKLTQTSVYNSLKTDRDWHYAAENSKLRGGYRVHLNMQSDASCIVTRMAAYAEDDEYAFSCPDEDESA
nr:aldehyde dehydrogenase, conserved site-containing protein [Tanacetum cinerariifolium]